MHSIVRLFLILAIVASQPETSSAAEVPNLLAAPALAVSRDGNWLAVGSRQLLSQVNESLTENSHVRLLDAESGREVRALSLPGEEFDTLRSLAFSPDGTLLAWGGYGRVHLSSVDSGRRLAVLQGHQSHFDSIAFSPDGRYLAGGNADKQIAIWSLKLPDDPHPVVPSAPFGHHPEAVSAIAFWPGSRQAVSEFGSESIGESIIAAASGKQLRFWNAQTGKELETYRQEFEQYARDMAWSPDGTLLAVCGNGFISLRNGFSLRDLSLGAEIRHIAHPASSNSSYFQVEFAHDGRTFAASDSTSVYVWETGIYQEQSGKLLSTIRATHAAASLLGALPLRPLFTFDPNSKRLYITLDSGIGAFDPSTGEKLNWPSDQQLPAPTQQADLSAANPPLPREQYLLEQIEGLLKESEALRQQGRFEEARQHRDKAAYRAEQLAEFLRTTPVPDVDANTLISNGSFERATVGDPPSDIQTLQPGSNAIAGWTTFDPHPVRDNGQLEQDWGGRPRIVDWIGPDRWKASHGECSLDIDGGISQSVATKSGETYVLTFDMAGNPETDYPIQQLVRVEISRKVYEFHFDPTCGTKDNLRWTNRTVLFEAADSLTTIRFVNAKPNVHSAGVALDNVSSHRLDPAITDQAQELFSRSMRFEREANGLRDAGRTEDARDHAEKAAVYRRQLEALLDR